MGGEVITMLFIAIQTHKPEECPASKAGAQMLHTDPKQSEVKVAAIYRCGPAHTLYYIIESDEMEKIERFLEPGMTRCRTDIKPVVKMS